MKYKGTDLLLDNFRSVLKRYSVDVQDVVRSAILDGVDISEYIDICKNNPYRLDQIRLGIKEKVNPIFFKIKSGECLFKIRHLEPTLLETVLTKMENEQLSDALVEKLIDWVSAGYSLYGINISIIPKYLYDVFEQGFKKGFDMTLFNNGYKYTPEEVQYYLIIMSNGKNVKSLLNIDNNGKPYYHWGIDCLSQLASFSKVNDDGKWVTLVQNISPKIGADKLNALISCVKNNIDITTLSRAEWSADCVRYILKAYDIGVDYQSLISLGPDNEDALLSKLNELIMLKNKKVSGRLRKY